MKRFLLCLLLLPFFAAAQSKDESGKFLYSEVVPQPEALQTDLYTRAVKAIPQTAKEVIKEEPTAVTWQDEKQLLIKTESLRLPVKLKYLVILQQKDGRYMYSITDIFIEDKKSRGMIPAENSQFFMPVDKSYYMANGNLKPQGLAIQNLSRVYLEEMERAITAEAERIKKAMALPSDNNW